MLAYGQTGTGKTWTIQVSAAEPGVLPRALQLILASVRRTDKHELESLSDEMRELTKYR